MRIKQILLKNFATVNEIELDLSDDITYLIGENGSGKTTCGLNAVWFILKGLAKTGKEVLHADRFRFIGKYGKSAIGQITLYDEKEDIEIYIQRKITKGATKLQIATSDDRTLDAGFVDRIFNIFSINPEGFSKLSSKDQAKALGIDTSEFDAKKKVLYDRRRELGYAVKRIKAALEECKGPTSKTEHVDIKALLKKKESLERANRHAETEAQDARMEKVTEAFAYNKLQEERKSKIASVNQRILFYETTIRELEAKLKDAKDKQEAFKEEKKRLPEPLPLVDTENIPLPKIVLADTTSLTREIEEAEEQNKEADAWDRFAKIRDDYTKAKEAYEEKDSEYKQAEQERISYLRSRNLPFANVTINDSGELLVDGRPFRDPYFSKGEILGAGIKIAASMNPELKYVFIPDSQSLDEKTRDKLFSDLIEKGFQVVVEMVGTQKNKDHKSILLKESRIVENYDETENLL